ncbi:hypothetical protein ACFQ69_36195 [Streptomyces sp. NPDC056470]|uniref:hypothetical protein n=1 Tax=Streptomyces sp. NPDC056470 TaxID=3345831 RepID=UPI00369EB877
MVAASGDLEIRKPDQRLFELAAHRCGVSLADGGWMVGDNPTGDIGGVTRRVCAPSGCAAGPGLKAFALRTTSSTTSPTITILLNETE